MGPTINSRADLESLRGTPEFADAMRNLAGSMTIRVNVAEYPEGYGEPEYDGPDIDPDWQDQEDLTTIERLGFTKQQVLDEVAALDGE